MEGHVNAGDHDKGLGVVGGVFECRQPGEGTGNSILLTCDVVVHDLQVFAGFFGDALHVVVDVFGCNTDHVGPQGAQTVVGAALFIAGHQGVHCGAAGVHNVNDGFEIENVCERCQGGVFAQGVARIHVL